jgi:hypothetical protein
MRRIAGYNRRNIAAVILAAASFATLGCSSNAAPPDLTPITAGALVSERWSRDELNHFAVSFHSDDLIECGVKNDLWKLTERTERGYTWTAYQLTPKGSKVFFAIDLKGSGKGHEITLRGPYRLEIANITPGTDPDSRMVEIHWEIDWNKAPAELKACLPKFELSGHQMALFKLSGVDWKFLSYLKPEDLPPTQGATPAL